MGRLWVAGLMLSLSIALFAGAVVLAAYADSRCC